jgi:DNA-binding CsgD family transcriptional regulator
MDIRPLGRDAEIARVLALLLTGDRAPGALLITGDSGIGKTALWQHALRAAGSGRTVLASRPTSAERPLAFSALDDLLGDVAGPLLAELPGPRRRAVEAALLRDASPGGDGADGPERRVLARGVLDLLRILAGRGPVLIAIDDAQWLDRPSAAALEFCLRRLEREPVMLLLTCQAGDGTPLGLDRALPPERLSRMTLGPISPAATGEMLRSRLGVALPRQALNRLYAASGGNPCYAMEYARALAAADPRAFMTGEPLTLPPGLVGLVQHRVHRLAPDVRRVGWLVAASCDPRERLIRAADDDRGSWVGIDRAVDAGLIERDGDVLRFTHPLLRSVLYGEMPRPERRTVHRRLAAVAEDIEERARHLALGADTPDDTIATILDNAARHAAARGAPEEGAAFAEQAARLTPGAQPGVTRTRLVRAADYHFRAGDLTRSRELIDSALATGPAGPQLAPLLLRLATIYYHQSGWPLAEQTFRRAAAQATDLPEVRAHAQQELAFARLVAGDLPSAQRLAEASLAAAEEAGHPRLAAHSMARVAFFSFLQGRGPRWDLLKQAEALEAAGGEEPIGRLPMLEPALVTGMVLKWCDRLDEARPKLAGRYQAALDRGDEASLPFVLYHLSQLECWAGNWDQAEEYAREGCRSAGENRQEPMRAGTLYALALVRAHRGQVAEARQLVQETVRLCDATGNIPVQRQAIAVPGFLALSLDEPELAHAHLGQLAEAVAAVGLREPGVVKFLPDEIEALAALGELRLARRLTTQLETEGVARGRPWAMATAARCRALLAAAQGDLDQAREACGQALSRHALLPMPFELGRTLLVSGIIERRAKRKAAAREGLEAALASFEQLGATLWAAKARRELAKLAPRPSAGGLTASERGVAALTARGQSNREIASALFVTENTVQTHLRHIFQKLGVRSRTELTAHLLSPQPSRAAAEAAPNH